MPVEVIGIDHIYVTVRDLRRSEAFYDRALNVLGYRKVTSTIAGHTAILPFGLAGVVPHIKDGKLRALAVADGKRSPLLPDVPTLNEAGITGVEADAWFALLAPASTPLPIRERIHQAVVKGLASDAAKSVLAAQGMTLAVKSPAELAAMIPVEIDKWAAVIKAANVLPE